MPLRLAAALFLPTGACFAADEALVPESAMHFEDAVLPVLETACADCHHPEDPDNHVRFLDAAVADDLSHARGLWANVAEQLRNRTMPPADAEQPTEADRLAVADWIDARLRATACDGGEYAGPVVARRLNREEYAHTVRDLLRLDLAALDFAPSGTFPADGGGGEGFDNNGETLFLPPILMERYLQAAGEAVDRAVWSPRLQAAFGPDELTPAGDTLPPGGEASAVVRVYLEGDVDVRVNADGPADAPVVMKIDGVPAGTLTLDGAGGVPQRAEIRVRLGRGEHVVTAANAGGEPLTLRGLEVRDVRPGDPPPHVAASHRFLLGVGPNETPDDPRAAVGDALRRLARRAYRRPVDEADLAPLLALADRSLGRGDPWEEAFKLAARAALVSPKFLFRTEPPPDGAPRGEPAFVGDHALASRLSYFLWASMPDDELSAAADAGRLSDPVELDRQVDRMLADPRADAFAEAFAGQWLGTREVGARVAPDVDVFRDDFDDPVLKDLQRQPAELWAYLLREDRPLTELIDADYAVLNDRLAYFYGVAEATGRPAEINRGKPRWMREGDGGDWRRFDLDAVHRERRGGVLGLGAVLLATSRPDRTSPVLRGGVGFRNAARYEGPPAAAGRAGVEGTEAGPDEVGPRETRRAPGGPGVQRVSQPDGPAGVRAGRLRRDRPLAGRARTRRRPGGRLAGVRHVRHAPHRRGVRRPRRVAAGAAGPGGPGRPAPHREAAGLRAGPQFGRRRRLHDRPRRRARRGGRRHGPVAGEGGRRRRPVPHRRAGTGGPRGVTAGYSVGTSMRNGRASSSQKRFALRKSTTSFGTVIVRGWGPAAPATEGAAGFGP